MQGSYHKAFVLKISEAIELPNLPKQLAIPALVEELEGKPLEYFYELQTKLGYIWSDESVPKQVDRALSETPVSAPVIEVDELHPTKKARISEELIQRASTPILCCSCFKLCKHGPLDNIKSGYITSNPCTLRLRLRAPSFIAGIGYPNIVSKVGYQLQPPRPAEKRSWTDDTREHGPSRQMDLPRCLSLC